METGELLVLLAGRCVFSAYMVIRIHKGVIWLLVATIAEVLPAVSDLTHVLPLSAHRDIMS